MVAAVVVAIVVSVASERVRMSADGRIGSRS